MVKPRRLKSLWVTGTERYPTVIELDSGSALAYALTYSLNELTSNKNLGVWCCRTYENAIAQAKSNGEGEECQIYKVLPLGNPSNPPCYWGGAGTVLYPAIILSEYVETIDLRQ